jgi:hypothetical protein
MTAKSTLRMSEPERIIFRVPWVDDKGRFK